METLNYLNNGHALKSWLLTKDHKRIALLYLVSITVFCYNQERYIEECLEGVRAQTYRNTELIIIDDASTDRSSRRGSRS